MGDNFDESSQSSEISDDLDEVSRNSHSQLPDVFHRPTFREKRSTLFLQIGNIELQRVKDETRDVIKVKNERLKDDLKVKNEKIRKKWMDEYHKRQRAYEDMRKRQTNEWRVKTASSPYRLDLNEIERLRSNEARDVEKVRIRQRMRSSRIRNMNGVPEYNVCSKEVIKKIESPMSQLALEQYSLQLEDEIARKEEASIAECIGGEIEDIERRFPKIAMMRAFGLHHGGNSSSSASLANGSMASSLGSLQSLLSGPNSLIGKQRISAEKARELKQIDQRVYSGAGRYDEWGNFVLAENMKQKSVIVSAEYAQVSGNKGPIMDMKSFEHALENGER